ncbi:peptidase U62 modulator of DNA gyrase [Candidatus Rickettsiella viridis]|uniref:Peptidase U62 modulator of DNA gyrase n=1 Tax=Candidatus Rickettsiella viridis TaxID=676208 RepID=A0A2Z5UUK1_9COXI|nr:metalloprotease PmbA [Candidatus Rickettsiella viridis]BBB14620.1 peptidase U62 modulator of DNA gyrase [Candidatus Rickettsiella viridis]
MPNKMDRPVDFVSKQTDYKTLLSEILQMAKKKGASQVEANITHDVGFSVTVRMNEVETIEHNRNKSLGINVYFDQRQGSASSSDFSLAAIENAVEAACHIARFTTEDPFSGLPDAELLAKSPPNLDLHHPWSIDPQNAIELGKDCERSALAIDKRITLSEGVTLSTHQGLYLYANSNNFIGSYPSSRHSLSCSLVAKDKKGMQRDGSYTVSRDPHQLDPTEKLAKKAAEATLKRLNATRLSTCQAPVIFHAEIASSLIGNFLSAISGGNLYRKASFLVNHLGQPIFSDKITIHEQPHLLKGLGSAPFDDEGVTTRNRTLVSNGVLQGYLLSSYSARKLGMQTTGNAGGAHNIVLETSQLSLEDLIKQMDRGLLVTELMGQGVNLVTGDYSRGAVGFWVEHGKIQYPVEEITIAGNLRDMYKNIVGIGNDIDHRSSILTGSILLENMMIAGLAS